jgi:elongation factor Ts
MAISASAVKELRQKTGAGMMDCKNALVEADGDLDQAVKILRTKGLAAAAKKAHRSASDGTVVIVGDDAKMAMLELNCETDFVARNPDFVAFAAALANQVLESGVNDAQELLAAEDAANPGHTVEQSISQQVATIGENIVLRRVACVAAESGYRLGSYVHMGGKIGVIVAGSGSVPDEALHDVAMHVAASEPRFVNRAEVTEKVLDTEREIALKQAVDQGKPEHIAERIVTGKMEKFFEQSVLLEQPFAKDTSTSVGEYVRTTGGDDATITTMVRFKLGEDA